MSLTHSPRWLDKPDDRDALKQIAQRIASSGHAQGSSGIPLESSSADSGQPLMDLPTIGIIYNDGIDPTHVVGLVCLMQRNIGRTVGRFQVDREEWPTLKAAWEAAGVSCSIGFN